MKNYSLQNRSYYHDLLRILASFAVICIHVCSESSTCKQELFLTPTWTFLNFFNSLSRFAVPVFVMLSGSFILDKYKEGSLKVLYTKNIFRLVCSYIFWSAFYVAFEILKNLIKHEPSDIKSLIYQLIRGEHHLWFIPMLIFLYAVTPLIKQLCNNKKLIHYFLILAFIPIIFNFVNFFITIKPVNAIFKYADFQFVSGYTVYYILGYYLTKYDIPKKYRVLTYLLAVLSVVLTVFLSFKHYSNGNKSQPFVYEYLSLTVLIISVAIFLLFKYGFSKIQFKERTQRLIVKLSSLTFGVYLSHIFFVDIVKKTPLTVENLHPIVSVPLIVLLIFIFSAFVTWVISKIPVLKKYII